MVNALEDDDDNSRRKRIVSVSKELKGSSSQQQLMRQLRIDGDLPDDAEVVRSRALPDGSWQYQVTSSTFELLPDCQAIPEMRIG